MTRIWVFGEVGLTMNVTREPNLSPDAVHLLKRLQADVLANPKMYNQCAWGDNCGTPCCFAGKLCLMVDGKIPLTGGLLLNPVMERAGDILGLSKLQRVQMFIEFDPLFYNRKGERELSGLGINTIAQTYAARGADFLDKFIARYTR